ncbi:MAG: DUF790 family protein [Thermoprotei archaeon]
MLPAQLLRVQIRGEYIKPVYAELSHENLYLAEKLINIFKNFISKKLGELENELNEAEVMAESEGYNYKFIKGLITLLKRRLIVKKMVLPYDPLLIRLEVFKTVNQLYNGFALTQQERKNVIDLVAQKLNMNYDDVENGFRAIYEEENTIDSFQEISPEELIRLYNLSLTQTLLFKCINLTANIKATGHKTRQILWNIKRNGLLYMAEKINESIRITIDGPASVIKQTERYGTNLAKTLPSIISADHWTIEASIVRKTKLKNKHLIYKFITNDANKHLYPVQSSENIITYDSSLEEDFHKRFNALKSDWTIIREPEPLVVGSKIFIPDFVFIRDNEKVYLEIVGFWTKEYIKRKIEKMKDLKNVKMIIAIDESIDEFKIEELPYIIIKFKRSLPSYEVLKILNSLFPKNIIKETTRLKITDEQQLINIDLDGMKLSDVINMLKTYNISDTDFEIILEKLGYKIDWNTLDPNRAIVRKIKNN